MNTLRLPSCCDLFGHDCDQGDTCPARCTPLIQTNHDWTRNDPYDSASEIVYRLPVLIFCALLCFASFVISAVMLGHKFF